MAQLKSIIMLSNKYLKGFHRVWGNCYSNLDMNSGLINEKEIIYTQKVIKLKLKSIMCYSFSILSCPMCLRMSPSYPFSFLK